MISDEQWRNVQLQQIKEFKIIPWLQWFPMNSGEINNFSKWKTIKLSHKERYSVYSLVLLWFPKNSGEMSNFSKSKYMYNIAAMISEAQWRNAFSKWKTMKLLHNCHDFLLWWPWMVSQSLSRFTKWSPKSSYIAYHDIQITLWAIL